MQEGERAVASCLKPIMPISCPDCAATMPDGAGFCPDCGRDMDEPERAVGKIGLLPRILAGALSYCLLPSFVFLMLAPYKHDRFVRFHAFQSWGAWLLVVVIVAILRILAVVSGYFVVVGTLVLWLASMIAAVGIGIGWLLLVVKALQGQMFGLPLIGELAEEQASKDEAAAL